VTQQCQPTVAKPGYARNPPPPGLFFASSRDRRIFAGFRSERADHPRVEARRRGWYHGPSLREPKPGSQLCASRGGDYPAAAAAALETPVDFQQPPQGVEFGGDRVRFLSRSPTPQRKATSLTNNRHRHSPVVLTVQAELRGLGRCPRGSVTVLRPRDLAAEATPSSAMSSRSPAVPKNLTSSGAGRLPGPVGDGGSDTVVPHWLQFSGAATCGDTSQISAEHRGQHTRVLT
jgi:hypothetical protein